MQMNGIRGLVLGGLLLSSQGVAAAQDVTGLACSTGELSLVSGSAFSASCTGDLHINAASVITADESITLLAAGNLWIEGTLVAPTIVLTAYADITLVGGFFSGSSESFPDVQATSHAGLPSATVRVFSDIVAQPYIHPIYGAVTFTHTYVEPSIATDAEVHSFIVINDVPTSPVPEPALPMLFALGAGLVFRKGLSINCRRETRSDAAIQKES
jgi:hypothetical protein